MLIKPPMYLEHPVNFYNTKKEKELITAIQKKFPDYDVENPNQTIHKDNYLKWKERTGNGMNYYFKIVLPKMTAGTFFMF